MRRLWGDSGACSLLEGSGDQCHARGYGALCCEEACVMPEDLLCAYRGSSALRHPESDSLMSDLARHCRHGQCLFFLLVYWG